MAIVVTGPVYTQFKNAQKPAISAETEACAVATVGKLLNVATDDSRPGMLLGKIQSGKTRTFLAAIALALDNGYEVAVVFTKGTRALTRQTVARIRSDFAEAIKREVLLAFDIRAMPDNLTDWELAKKLVIVCKKEDDNLRDLSENLLEVYPELAQRKILLIDDEADFASVGYRRRGGIVTAAVIPTQIDDLRRELKDLSFIQVTATPYSLYLQPDGELNVAPNGLYKPIRPAFTELVPGHAKYIGGEYYFEQSQEPGTVASFLNVSVELAELEVLKRKNAALFKLEECLTSPLVKGIRRSVVSFVLGAWIRRWQQAEADEPPKRYSFIVHTETAKGAHGWQAEVVQRIVTDLRSATDASDPVVDSLLSESYEDLKRSVEAAGLPYPTLAAVKAAFADALNAVMTATVNSEKDIDELLDESGQLQLRTPYNIFIGGQILDRGLTIENLIGFFYGRRPQRAQQDTVLQHSRMYGNRPPEDLAVTRFYTTQAIYRSMAMIHEFDSALREAIENGGQEEGVIFLRSDDNGGVIPCSPNKTLLSTITSVRSGSRLLVPAGFNTRDPGTVAPLLEKIDGIVAREVGDGDPDPKLVDLAVAEQLIDLIDQSLQTDPEAPWETKSFKAALRYLATRNGVEAEKGKVVVIARRGREMRRVRDDGRLQNAPDSRVERTLAEQKSPYAPALLLYRQNGTTQEGWNGSAFWWPVLRAPKITLPIIFASEEQS